jgi:hypothetical protein
MKTLILAAIIGVFIGTEVVPAQAQMDLTPRLESLRYRRLLEHQQRMRKKNRDKSSKRAKSQRTSQVQIKRKPLKSKVKPVHRHKLDKPVEEKH